MEKAYRFRIYPNKMQEIQIQKTFGCCRFVYNHYLAKRIEMYKTDKTTMSAYDCSKDMTQLKEELVWLRDADSQALKASLKDLDTAYKNFFRRIKKGDAKAGFPKFKSKKDNNKAYRATAGGNIHIKENAIQLPKLGLVKCRGLRPVEGRILSATVSQRPSGNYFVSILCTEVQIQALPKTGAELGIDLGIKEYISTSEGQTFANPKYLKKSQKKLAKLQRQLSRKQNGSSNANKARIKVARLHEKIVNQRTDFSQKLSTQLIRDYDFIGIENLKIKNMLKNHHVAKVISDVSWGEFVRQLEYKALWYGKEVQKVDTFYASSQICSACGFKNKEVKNLSVRQWTCPECGVAHHRDINASINILKEALKVSD